MEEGKYIYINKKNGDTISTNIEEDDLLVEFKGIAKDKGGFAASLLEQYEKKGFLSEAQWYWVVKMVHEKDQLYICDTAEMFELLKNGKLYVKFPELKIDMRIYESGIVVNNGKKIAKYTKDGILAPANTDPSVLNKFLLVFCKEGAKNCMQRLGKKTGVCCYCGIILTHDISIGMGYGPRCAEKHGLPFPMEEYNKSLAARKRNVS